MNRCDTCKKDLADGGFSHYFCGYGWYARFCETCCPREMDGSECRDHDPATCCQDRHPSGAMCWKLPGHNYQHTDGRLDWPQSQPAQEPPHGS